LRICAVIDYATKYCLAATGRGGDPPACLDAAVAEAERILGPDDLRDDRGELKLVDETTGDIIDVAPAPIAVVSNNVLFPWRGLSNRVRRRRPAAAPRPDPRPITADHRRHRAVLRHAEVRAPVRASIDDGGALAVDPPDSVRSTTAPDLTSRSATALPGRPISAYRDRPARFEARMRESSPAATGTASPA
jgi:hypothetical protein